MSREMDTNREGYAKVEDYNQNLVGNDFPTQINDVGEHENDEIQNEDQTQDQIKYSDASILIIK